MAERLTVPQRRAIAVELGHERVTIEPTSSGKRYTLRCTCGWGSPLPDGRPTVTRATEREAAGAAVHHVRTAVDRYLADRAKAGASPFGLSRVSGMAG
jgi:hypothetical protein